MSDDWEYSEQHCAKCQSQMATRRCNPCEGEGIVFAEDDDDWEADERCGMCNGQGHETWCRECGWDANFKCFLSPEYERAFNEKQAAQAANQ